MSDNAIYIINDKVIFTPDSNTLCPVNDNTKPVVLHTPSSQCLLLLLQNNNQVVSQKVLFEEIWEKNGALVTPNTLYQNIALIRKAFKSAGLEEEVIKTIPKQGVKIAARLIVNTQKELGDLTEFENNPHSHLTSTLKAAPPFSLEPFTVEEHKPENHLTSSPSVLHKLIRNKFFFFILPGLISVFFVYWLCVFYGSQGHGNAFFKDYMDIGKINNCQVFSSYHGVDISKAKFETMARLSGMTCQPGEMAWLTFNRQYEMSMLIKCDKQIADKNAVCQNFLYEEASDNEN
ncbi:winged helix-turn-helix domain-containing protein [Atlantibacter subterranea]|uniref:winged helix-turn-helix domain-containing protein n=1 Tax=Atlantibacter subterraneus TaxID=255519 RepID=UPI0020C32EE2|nr:winged helix-turn-helix domain-containing protein [Atlantibacter subterranea]UTJ49479.1 winged helix-turn-helix domain-containing protein [Atlantibacter subterranea]